MAGWSICPAPRCCVAIPERLAFCKTCWALLPACMQERVAGLWGKAELAHERRRAIEDAGKVIGRRRTR